MNKYQEALDWVMEGNDSCGTEWDLLQELVDKETPMKLTYKRGIYDITCSKCGNPNLNTKWTYGMYCSGCGQKIDWSEVE